MRFSKSTSKGKKYMVIGPNGKTIHFGDSSMQQYKDTTKLGLYTHLDHLDETRRKSYLARAKGIKNKKGEKSERDIVQFVRFNKEELV